MRVFVVGITLNRFVNDSTLRCLYLSVTVDRQSADAEEENRLMIASAQDRRLKIEKYTRFCSILVFEVNSEGSPQVNNNGRSCHLFLNPRYQRLTASKNLCSNYLCFGMFLADYS